MSSKAKKTLSFAIRNNMELCDLVHRAHGNKTSLRDNFWFVSGKAVPFYPNLVTLEPVELNDLELDVTLSLLEESPPGPKWGIKDSYARLDLTPKGFNCTVQGSWLARNAVKPKTDKVPRDEIAESPSMPVIEIHDVDVSDWQRVLNAAELRIWEAAWSGIPLQPETEDTLRDRIPPQFPDSLLQEPALSFWQFMSKGEIVAGFMLNESAEVVGLSNVFSREGTEAEWWNASAKQAAQIRPAKPLVCWEADPDAVQARRAGFEPIGHMRVWIRDLYG